MLTQPIKKFDNSITLYLEHKCLENVSHQIKRGTATFLNNFYGKLWVGFCLKTGKYLFVSLFVFISRFHFKNNRKSIFKIVIFKVALPLRDWYVLTITRGFYFDFEISFLENENLFLKNCLLVETSKMKNVAFPYKNPLSKDNFKINRIESAKWTYKK